MAETALLLAAVALLTATGPFGTYLLGSWPERMAYWLRTAGVGYVLYRPSLLLCAVGGRRLWLSEAQSWTAAVLLAGIPMSLWLWWFGPAIELTRGFPPAPALLETYVQVLLIAGLCALALWFASSAPESRSRIAVAVQPPPIQSDDPARAGQMAVAPAQPIGPRLAERLPRRIGVEVIALHMEDHYVRVHTRAGDALVLMRMGDAVADLEGLDGCRVHRSWWAARSAVSGHQPRNRSVELVLDNGLRIPVARQRLEELRARGWLSKAPQS